MSIINWGILGAGNILGQFVHDLLVNNASKGRFTHVVRSIGSLSPEKSKAFVEANKITPQANAGVEPSLDLYDSLYENPDVDVIYIGTPHPFHRAQAIAALENGKHVLCEKPVTVTKEALEEILAKAKEKNLFFMEAVWTRFFPLITLLKKKIFDEQVLGDTKRLIVDFGYDADIYNLPPTSRVRDPKLAGGALLDIGVYNITYARIMLDQKLGSEATKFNFKSFQTIDDNDKVDYVSLIIMQYVNGKQAILSCTNWSSNDGPFLKLEGTKGKVEIWAANPACPKKWKITFKDEKIAPIEYEDTSDYKGFIYEADAVAGDIIVGKTENSIMPWAESLLVMDILDSVRRDSGLEYPAGIEN